MRKNESEPSQVKTTTLACMVLHNICIEKGDTICSKLNITSNPLTNAKRDSRTLRKALEMTCCRKATRLQFPGNSNQGHASRNVFEGKRRFGIKVARLDFFRGIPPKFEH